MFYSRARQAAAVVLAVLVHPLGGIDFAYSAVGRPHHDKFYAGIDYRALAEIGRAHV